MLFRSRKIWDNSDYIIPRIQQFRPPSGKIKRKKASEKFNMFLSECFNSEGKIIDKEYNKIVSKNSCTYCPYSNQKELCNKLVTP